MRRTQLIRHGLWLLRAGCVLLLVPGLLLAQGPAREPAQARSTGSTIYVPAYSHVYHGSKNRPFPLTVVLTVRNIDPVQGILLEEMRYHDSEGKALDGYGLTRRELAPMAAWEFVVEESDLRGGAGAGFVVRWSARQQALSPLVETVMVGTSGGQGISLTSRGVELPR